MPCNGTGTAHGMIINGHHLMRSSMHPERVGGGNTGSLQCLKKGMFNLTINLSNKTIKLE